ncbi:hypothetical protein D9758_012832 [Tetrapyrgos nigripes]|uniref:Uncharacterized protein n=1 Tax=Tetrapyrgos nigripes TaxID=182062 RepID=A0A8H5FIP2_9AGAR|nr:hypothetical protein D9758_012832 [Tetrapyrgos nigripes]
MQSFASAEDYLTISDALRGFRPAPQAQLNPYTVKNKVPLPKGDFSILLHQREQQIGGYVEQEDKYILPVNVDIIFRGENVDVGGPGTKIGSIRGLVILLSLMCNTGYLDSFQEICDDHSQELSDMASKLFDERGKYQDESLSGADEGDILYIQEVYVEPKWRGYGIGLLALRGLIDTMPSFEMDKVLLDPAPMSISSNNAEEGCYPSRPLKETINALTKHWGLLGFKRVSKKQDVNYMETWTGRIKPPIEDVVPHLF